LLVRRVNAASQPPLWLNRNIMHVFLLEFEVLLGVLSCITYCVPMHANYIEAESSNKGHLLSGTFSNTSASSTMSTS